MVVGEHHAYRRHAAAMRKARPHLGTGAGGRPDLDPASDEPDTLLHARQAEARGRRAAQPREVEAQAVVAHAQLEVRGSGGQGHPDVAGARVAEHVGDGLLSDPEGRGLDLGRERLSLALLDGQMGAGLPRVSGRRTSATPRGGRCGRGWRGADRGPGPAPAGWRGPRSGRRFRRLPSRSQASGLAEGLEVDLHDGEHLADLVVELTGDVPPLLFLRRHQAPREPAHGLVLLAPLFDECRQEHQRNGHRDQEQLQRQHAVGRAAARKWPAPTHRTGDRQERDDRGETY